MNRANGDWLVRCFEPCFVRVLELLDARAAADPGESTNTDAAVVRESLLELFNESVFAAEERFPANAALAARRFVSAWADERLASDSWPGRDTWRQHPLQSDWGEGRAAGEWFFDTVARLNPARPEDTALASLALRCLTLGFDGRLYYTPQEIADLRRSLVLRFGFTRSPRLFPPSAEGLTGTGKTEEEPRGSAGALLRWLAPLAAAAALAGAYVLVDRSLIAYVNGNL